MDNESIDWERVRQVRYAIEFLESQLPELYNERYEIMRQMSDDKMKQREIGAVWGISNPRVSGILNGK